MQLIASLNSHINAFVWGPAMLALFIFTGLFLSFKTGFIQITRWRCIMQKTVGSLFKHSAAHGEGGLTPFQAMTTALAGTVGTGNIAGVTGALFAGGPGAVFWMWVSSVLGMATKYAEIALAMKYRIADANGTLHGGPMYYIEAGLGRGWRWLAVCFALLGGLASFGIGNIAQGSEIAGAMSALFNTPRLITGIGLALVVGFVALGGVKRVGNVTALLVPLMSVLYLAAGLFVLIVRAADVPAMLFLIVKSAFSAKAAAGGTFGYSVMRAMKLGFTRGIFSNEAGLGSAPIAHAASSASEPCEQAMWGVFEVFADTIVICSVTAFTVLLSGILDAPGGQAAYVSAGAAAAAAFDAVIPGHIGSAVIQISLMFFAVSSMISWCYYGESCWGYLSSGSRTVIFIYKLIFTAVCVAGAAGSGALMWDISDTLNGLMAIPNLTALLLLSGTVAALSRDYFNRDRQ